MQNPAIGSCNLDHTIINIRWKADGVATLNRFSTAIRQDGDLFHGFNELTKLVCEMKASAEFRIAADVGRAVRHDFLLQNFVVKAALHNRVAAGVWR